MPTPSSSRTMCARLVLPSPGGPGHEIRSIRAGLLSDGLTTQLLLELEDDPIGRLLPNAGDRLETSRILAEDRAAQLGDGRAGDDRERDLRPDAAHREELDEQ